MASSDPCTQPHLVGQSLVVVVDDLIKMLH